MMSWPAAGPLSLTLVALWLAAARAEAPPLPPPRPAESATAPSPGPEAPDADLGRCMARLAEVHVAAEAMPPITEGACRVEHPLKLTALSASVKISGGVQTACPMAEATARWVSEVVEPAARQHLGRTLATLSVGTSYACRGQNRVLGAKLSEHGLANALDIAGFTFTSGAPVGVKANDPATPEGRFTDTVRKGACGFFTTVLGPGSDPYHADHLHLDLRARRAGYRICE